MTMGIWNDDAPTCGDDCNCKDCATIAKSFTLALADVEELLEPTRSIDVRLLALEVVGHSEEQAELAELFAEAGEPVLAALHHRAAGVLMGDAARIAGGAS